MDYKLVRSKRKTISFSVTAEGQILVRAPWNCPRSYIDQFVSSRGRWIAGRQEAIWEALARREEFQIREGDTLPFFGEHFSVIFRAGNLATMDLDEKRIRLPERSVEQLRPLLGQLYKKYGLPLLRRRLDFWAGQMGIAYETLHMSSAVRRWGSCSNQGNIRISWYLLMAPERAIDYVLVHELAHRKHFDHSPAFWALVARYIPDYKEQKTALRETQNRLFSQGWSK